MSRRHDYHDLRACCALADRFALLSVSEERTLGERAAAGDDEARWALVFGNLRLAAKYALRRAGRYGPVEDIFGDAILGLYDAACTFDPARGWRYTTHAKWRMHAAMRKAGPDYLRVRVPFDLFDSLKHRTGERADSARRAMGTQCATEALPNDGSDWTALFGPAPEDETEAEVEHLTELNRLAEWLDLLPPRLRQIVSERYGLDGNQPATFPEIGKRLGVSYQRAQMLERRAIELLRQHARLARTAS